MYSMPALGKGMIHVPAAIEGDSRRFHHATQKGMQFKPYELFISGIFHLIFSDHPWPWVIETKETELADKEGLLYSFFEDRDSKTLTCMQIIWESY